MSLIETVATGMLALLLVFIGMVIWATLRQIDGEARAAADQRDS